MRTNTPKPDLNNIRPLGQCDLCAFVFHLDELQYQMEYRGMQLQSTGWLRCPPCMDIPQPQMKPIILPPDPVSVQNARPVNYDQANNDYLATQGGDHIVEEDEDPIVAQPNGNVMLDDLYD